MSSSPSKQNENPETNPSEDLLFEEECSEEFGGTAVDFTPSCLRTRALISSQSSSSNLSFKRISLEVASSLAVESDSSEEVEVMSKMLNDIQIDPEASDQPPINQPTQSLISSAVTSMTMEEINNHISRCLQLSTENKISTKNAFALELIDCMTVMLNQNKGEENFAAVACQLDAGTKIYSHRVDALHQQVVKLAESCIFAERTGKKKNVGDNENSSDEDERIEEDGHPHDKLKDKLRRKKAKKRILAAPEQITRKLKGKDPRSNFVKMEAKPGGIFASAKRDPSDLSLTLSKNVRFWPDPNKPPLSVKGRVPFPCQELINELVAKFKSLRANLNKPNYLPLLALPYDPKPSTSEDPQPSTSLYGNPQPSTSFYDNPKPSTSKQEITHHMEDDNDVEPEPSNVMNETEVNIVAMAESKMMEDLKTRPSRLEVLKTIFYKEGESEYHYLKMENKKYWAGPSYWKRAHGAPAIAFKKKRIGRKKKEPAAIKYDQEAVEKSMAPNTSNRKIRIPQLSRKTLNKWSSKKLTLPQDIHYQQENLVKLFHVDTQAIVPDEEKKEEVVATETEDNVEEKNEGEGAADHSGDEDESPWDGSNLPLVSDILDPQNCEMDTDPLEGTSTPGPSTVPTLFQPAADPGYIGIPSTSTSDDVYEGENLVPMVKMVRVEPIRCVARPNRVNFHHLKEVMLQIIREKLEELENKENREDESPVCLPFKEVLSELVNSDRLQRATREDLTPAMGFLSLMTLVNEHGFLLTQEAGEDGVPIPDQDVFISQPVSARPVRDQSED